jgi:transposase
MPASHSYDLRTKVINAIDSGMRKSKASSVFQISRNTINLWLNKREETGDYKGEVGYQKGYNSKITDLEKFEEFAQAYGSLTQKEMAEKWKEKISDRTIGKALKKLNHTRKKTCGYQERDEEKREEFKLEISKVKPENRVYIDESGMDNREDYGYGWNEKGKRFYDLKSGKRSLRASIMSGLCQGKLIAPLTFEGSYNCSVFEREGCWGFPSIPNRVVEKWLEEKLLTQLKPGKVLILDNATFHQADTTPRYALKD